MTSSRARQVSSSCSSGIRCQCHRLILFWRSLRSWRLNMAGAMPESPKSRQSPEKKPDSRLFRKRDPDKWAAHGGQTKVRDKQTWTCWWSGRSCHASLGLLRSTLRSTPPPAAELYALHRRSKANPLGSDLVVFLAKARQRSLPGARISKAAGLSAKPMTSRSAFERSGGRLRGFRVGREK